MAEPYHHRLPWEQIDAAARREAEPRTAAPLVSVDWDFFLPPPDLSRFAEPRAELLAAGAGFYLEEWFSPQRQAREWAEITDRLRALGTEPQELWRVEPSDPLAGELRRRFVFRRVWIADSHLWGLYVSALSHAESGASVRLLSFDAHHDLGYINYLGDDEQRSRERAYLHPSCDDWVQCGLRHGVIESMELIYPRWRGLSEWASSPPTLPEELSGCVRVRECDEWLADEAGERVLADLLVVRSSSYAHPFDRGDERYLELVRRLAPRGYRCLDCAGPLAIGAQNACRPRPSRY